MTKLPALANSCSLPSENSGAHTMTSVAVTGALAAVLVARRNCELAPLKCSTARPL